MFSSKNSVKMRIILNWLRIILNWLRIILNWLKIS